MSDTLTVRIPDGEKEAWRKVAYAVGEDLGEFAGMAVRWLAGSSMNGSPWDELLGSVKTDAPAATSQNVRMGMR